MTLSQFEPSHQGRLAKPFNDSHDLWPSTCPSHCVRLKRSAPQKTLTPSPNAQWVYRDAEDFTNALDSCTNTPPSTWSPSTDGACSTTTATVASKPAPAAPSRTSCATCKTVTRTTSTLPSGHRPAFVEMDKRVTPLRSSQPTPVTAVSYFLSPHRTTTYITRLPKFFTLTCYITLGDIYASKYQTLH